VRTPPPLLAALLALASACTSRSEPAFAGRAGESAFAHVAIAAPEDALTFARIERDGAARVLAVRSYQGGAVEGVDLSRLLERDVTSAVEVFAALGYDALARAIGAASADAVAAVPAGELVAPLDLGDAHVAAGTNYPEHAGEAGVDEGPFLFSKRVRPTGPYADVPAGDGLLDYEVEVALVPLAPLRASDARPATMGLVLANDYTDRATLLRALDPWDVASGKGFTTGKSFPGFLPIGNLLVIPRDVRRFLPDLELRLYVNGLLRQRERASAMVWDVDRLLAETWSRAPLRWDHRGEQVALLDGDVLGPDTLLLSGTPHGTVFAGISTAQMVRGAGAWLLSGFRPGVADHVVETYVADARAANVFLQPGDEVVIHVDRLGVIRNRITR
jgi:2-keto-4-pentenoate hydratase/2-oxohepta-3-ene-1,7-dioic acid hydratase in catechol pathway